MRGIEPTSHASYKGQTYALSRLKIHAYVTKSGKPYLGEKKLKFSKKAKVLVCSRIKIINLFAQKKETWRAA